MALQYVKSERNKNKLIDGPYLFCKEKTINNRVYWKCDQYYQRKCPARIHVENDVIVNRLKKHNHAGDDAHLQVVKVLNKTKQKAIESQELPHLIATQACVKLPTAVAGQLPPFSLIKRNIRNVRNVKTQAPPNPINLLQLKIPLEYRVTHSNEPFLLHDSEDGPNRILIFSTSTNLQLLSSAKRWFADGTFKSVPKLFSQLYTIHGDINSETVPLVYCLMAKRNEENYIKLFSELKVLQPNLTPNLIMTDYEKAAINGFRKTFHDAIMQGCLFHLSQCIFRSIQTNGLQKKYEESSEFALKMRMLAALAFVPELSVVQYFEHLCDYGNFPDAAQPVLDYFEDNWIGRPDRRRIRRPPMFDLTLWNCFDIASVAGPKTNNVCEGWHNAFNTLIGAQHPSVWKFIEKLKMEQARTTVTIEQHIAGTEGPPPKKKYKDCALRIKKIVDDVENREILDYLKGIAHNLSF